MEKYLHLAKKLNMIYAFVLILFSQTYADELKSIQLHKPQMDGGKPFMH
jgi:hypothetical protein